ncbi:MAG: pectinesterase family protein [Prevotella sp.]
MNYLSRLLVALLALLPLTATAQESVTLAEWDIEQGYDVADNVYTPNGGEWSDVTATWFNLAAAPVIRPDAQVGNPDSYALTAWSKNRYWQLCSGWNNHVFRIENDAANAITDFTDASQHNVYYEIQFPTVGYKDVSVEFECAYGANAEAGLEAVASTDGGITWVDAGLFKTANTWWTYNKNTVQLSANNKEKVILRLIAVNGFASNWNLNNIKVIATAAEPSEPQTVDETDFTATWELKTSPAVTTATTSKDGLFSVAELSWGDKLEEKGVRTDNGISRVMFQPTEVAGSRDDANAIVFTLKPKKALTFTPKQLSFNASRVGTNGGKFDVVVISGDQTTVVGEGIVPQLAKEDPYVSNHTFDLSKIPPTDDILYVKIYVMNVDINKQYAFSDVVIKGDVAGQIEPVPTYTMSVKLGTDNAGKVSVSPAGSEFDEGTSITVSATENFGYHFKAWTDEQGNEVSTMNPYTFDISANTTLIASYDKVDTYALNLVLEGGANDNLVQLQPAGYVVDGVHWYETGTDVKLTALNNRILTFTNWEDNSTDMERTVKMDGEKNLTAHFSCVDYIVGWDLYYDQPAKDRAADYKADSENAGMLSLRKADGTTSSWLTRGIGNGMENGKYAARIWKLLSEEWYWEISFSSKGYENLVISSCIGDDYNTYSVNNVEYSIDGGVTFTKVGEFNPPYRGWDGPKEFALPADANDQDRVYIRWMPDRTSEKVGVTSDYDGTSIAEIFVLADAGALADEQATLVSSNPTQGATGVSRNGSIILNFDNKIKAGTGSATLNGEDIVPIISGKSAIFKYSGLKYNTQYTFVMPDGVLTSRSGNAVAKAEITFTTMERQQPEARLYDAVVAQDGSGDYTTLQAAIDNAPEGRGTPYLIFVKNGRYNEHIDIPAAKPYLHIIGQDRDKTVIYDNRLSGGENAYSVDPGATVVVKGANTFFENITLENSYGHEMQAGPQALALNTVADRIALNNVALLSYQDTWITTSTQKNRHYIKNSLIEGAVDFIYNGGDVYLDGDTLEINRPSGGYIVAPNHTADTKWGYVFQNNVIRPGKDFQTGNTLNVTDVWLGRPWHGTPKTVFINTQTFVPIPAKGWYNTMGGLPELWADYNTVDANGEPLDLSQRESYYYYIDSSTSEKVEKFNVKNFLTDEEAAQYTLKNVLSGDDNWQPDMLCEPCDMPVANSNGTTITWEAVPYAICYVVIKNDEVVGFTIDTSFNGYTSDDNWLVQAVNEYGGLSKKATVNSTPTEINELSRQNGEAIIESVYSIYGTRTTKLQQGVNIVRMSDGRMKKIMSK